MSGKILIADDVATNRIVLKSRLQAAGYHVLLAADGAGCLALAARELPDLVLLDHALPDLPVTDVLAQLRAVGPAQVLVTAPPGAARLAVWQAGADAVLDKPLDEQSLLARLRSFMRAREPLEGLGAAAGGIGLWGLSEAALPFQMPGRIALITARPETALRLRRDLQALMADHLLVLAPHEALVDAGGQRAAADLFLLEPDLGQPADGLRLISDLRSRSASRHAAICLMAGENGASAAAGFDLGANDVIRPGVPPQELALRLARLLARKAEGDRLRASVRDGLRLAVIDPLTGLHNRRYGLARLTAIAAAAQAQGNDFAVMVVDLDRFKAVNDRWGHAAGDAVLVEVAQRLGQNLQGGDLLARIGGEEFLIALPRTAPGPAGLAEAQRVAERLCRAIEASAVPLRQGQSQRVTVSIGLTIAGASQPDSIAAIIDRADRALMRSKAAGRNQVTTSRSAA